MATTSRAAPDACSLLDADRRNASAKDLIALIDQGDENDPKFDARVTVLGEYIDHHVKEERNESFPMVCATRLDLVKMRAQP